jgi:hypothetical protein
LRAKGGSCMGLKKIKIKNFSVYVVVQMKRKKTEYYHYCDAQQNHYVQFVVTTA